MALEQDGRLVLISTINLMLKPQTMYGYDVETINLRGALA